MLPELDEFRYNGQVQSRQITADTGPHARLAYQRAAGSTGGVLSAYQSRWNSTASLVGTFDRLRRSCVRRCPNVDGVALAGSTPESDLYGT